MGNVYDVCTMLWVISLRGDYLYCQNCGKDVGESNFCPNCGKETSKPMVVHQNTCNDCVKVNKIAYALLAILLGGIGIHRFYARRFVSGILYILFCWTAIPAILGIVEVS